jgi:NAD(P)-dependent dehydrogenase (short-subunit alcohol dehydrogenase family)
VSAPARVALVTGASSGIGEAIARTLARAGYAVALGARRSEKLAAIAAAIEAEGGRAFATPLDLGELASIERCCDAVDAALGPIDVLVNNAGICVPGLLHEVAPEAIAREVAVNLVGPAWISQRVIRALLARGARGDLVFISSENAVKPRAYQPGYTASKWGLEGLARTLRAELDGTGIRATIVRPGPTFPTDFAQDWDPAILKRLLTVWRDQGVQRHLRWMPAQSVADAVAAVVGAAPGTHFDVVSLSPEAPPELRIDGGSR